MKVAHIIPPQWEAPLGRGQYRMTFVPWVLQNPGYAQELRAKTTFVILDHGLFEDDLSLPDPTTIALVGATLDPNEVVLPDVLGESGETVRVATVALPLVPPEVGCMFVPQARTMGDWTRCLACFLLATRSLPDLPIIGLSSLRRPESLRAQVGTRIPMMKYLQPRGFEMHLLGLCSVRHFVEEELPAALEFEVRGVDTCAAFALGARGLELTKGSPRLFLGDLTKYKSLSEDTLLLIKRNMDTLENWIEKGE